MVQESKSNSVSLQDKVILNKRISQVGVLEKLEWKQNCVANCLGRDGVILENFC